MVPSARQALPLAALLIGVLSPGVAAQAQTAAVCSLPSLNWAFNSLDQSPCLIAAYAQAACTGGSFNVPALTTGSYYVGPETSAQANPCTCSTPVWSLISACGACQNATFIETWNDWATNCTTVYSIYPESIPSGTAIPAWAYLAPPAGGTWDAVAAKNDAGAPESTASHASTVSTTSSSATSGSGSSSSASVILSTVTGSSPAATNTGSSSGSGGGGGGGSNTGAIAGGVVGGVVGLAIIAGLAFWLMRRRRTTPAQSAYGGVPPSDQGPPAMGQVPPTSATPVSGYTAPYSTGSTADQRLYNPNDPTTFPQASQSPFYQSAANPYQTPVSTPGPAPGQPLAPNRGYHGVPEV